MRDNDLLCINDLPSEILENITSNLTNFTDLSNTNLVNTKFNEVISKIQLCSSSKTKIHKCLLGAISNNDTVLINLLLDNGADNFNEAMIFAGSKGFINIVKLMIEYGATDYDNTMKMAAKNGYLDIVKLMTKYSTTNPTNYPMAAAASGGFINIVVYFMNLNVNIFYSIIEACKHGYLDIVKLLLDVGPIDQFTLDEALQYASRNGYLQIVELLLEYGATDYNNSLIKACIFGSIEIVTLMLSLGVTDFKIAVINAAENGHIDIVKLLIEKGVDNYNRILSIASFKGHLNIVKLMLTYDITDIKYAVIGAALNGHLDVIIEMLNYMNVTKDVMYSAFENAAIYGHLDTIVYILDYIKNVLLDKEFNKDKLVKAFLNASKCNNVLVVKYLYGLVDISSDSLNKAIINASGKGDILTVKYLLSVIENVENHTINESIVSGANYINIVKLMISLGADEYHVNKLALVEAASNNNFEVVELLISDNIDYLNEAMNINLYNNVDSSLKLVKLLVSHGANSFHDGFKEMALSGYPMSDILSKYIIGKMCNDPDEIENTITSLYNIDFEAYSRAMWKLYKYPCK